jgi:N-acetylglucosaminyldiphosphoundecaprenol N-acetyl-beta-D-mannosaminyltransferase
MEEALRLSDGHIQAGRRGYVCVTGVHGVMVAQSDEKFRSILNRSVITTPDGMPTVWVGRIQGHPRISRVFGPDYMLRMCELSLERGYRHFFYGGNTGVADELAENLTRRYPGLQVAGTYTPPFRPLNETEERELIQQLDESRPDLFWVGLSTPKQERFMAQYIDRFDVPLMIGVGAAFDIHTGRVSDAPNWVKNSGLQWLHRLMQDPKRLGKRYLLNNPTFVWKIGLQLTRIRDFSKDL